MRTNLSVGLPFLGDPTKPVVFGKPPNKESTQAQNLSLCASAVVQRPHQICGVPNPFLAICRFHPPPPPPTKKRAPCPQCTWQAAKTTIYKRKSAGAERRAKPRRGFGRLRLDSDRFVRAALCQGMRHSLGSKPASAPMSRA